MADDKSRRDESEEPGESEERATSKRSAGSEKSGRSEKSAGGRTRSSGKGGSTGKTTTASKAASKTRAKAPSEQRTGPVTFYRQVVAELRKVVWPTRDQLVTYFFVVMAFVLVMIALVSLLDLGFGKLVFAVFGGAGDS